MTEHEPERWLADPLTDSALRELLQAGSNERPRMRALQAAPAAVLALLAVKTAGATTPAVGVAAALGVRSAVTSALVLKWFASGVLAGAAALSLAQIPETRDAREIRAPSGVGSVRRPSAVIERPRLPTSASTPMTLEPGAPARPVLPRPDVAREVALLDATRSALLAGNARRALETLATLERLPSRVLAPEATVLRVRALLATNQTELARQVARRFIDAAPASPQARVLRGLFSDALVGAGTPAELPRDDSEIQTEAGGL